MVRAARADRRHALRVVVGLGVPGLALLFAGRPDLIIYAAFGSFVGMYGRGESPRARFRHQAWGAVVLLAGVAAGILLSHSHARAWTLVAAGAVFAAVASLLADALRLRPEGPFFGIFALGAIATVPPGTVSASGAMAISAATALFSVLVGVAGGLRPRPGKPARTWSRPTGMLAQAARYGIAIGIAGLIGLALGIDHANWAMASAAVPLAAPEARTAGWHGLRRVVHRGFHRVAGTMTGLVVTAALLLPHPDPALLAIAVMILLFPTELFMTHHYGVALGFFTPLIMLMTNLAAPAEPWTLVRDRAVDVVIGVAVGVAVAVLVPGPFRTDEHRDRSVRPACLS